MFNGLDQLTVSGVGPGNLQVISPRWFHEPQFKCCCFISKLLVTKQNKWPLFWFWLWTCFYYRYIIFHRTSCYNAIVFIFMTQYSVDSRNKIKSIWEEKIQIFIFYLDYLLTEENLIGAQNSLVNAWVKNLILETSTYLSFQFFTFHTFKIFSSKRTCWYPECSCSFQTYHL